MHQLREDNGNNRSKTQPFEIKAGGGGHSPSRSVNPRREKMYCYNNPGRQAPTHRRTNWAQTVAELNAKLDLLLLSRHQHILFTRTRARIRFLALSRAHHISLLGNLNQAAADVESLSYFFSSILEGNVCNLSVISRSSPR